MCSNYFPRLKNFKFDLFRQVDIQPFGVQRCSIGGQNFLQFSNQQHRPKIPIQHQEVPGSNLAQHFLAIFRHSRVRICFEAIARNRNWFRWPQRCNGQTGLTGLGRRAREMETEHPGFLKFAAAQVVLLFIVHRLQISHVNGYISILHLTHVQLSRNHKTLRRYLTYLTEFLQKKILLSVPGPRPS